MLEVLRWLSVIAAIVSAGCWLHGSRVKVTREEFVARMLRRAKRTGQAPNFAGASLDGWDMSATFAAQSTWNARGAIAAGVSVISQAIAPLL